MFYLIGGTPRAGKTTIAKRLSGELGVPWISTDTIETVVSEYVPEDKYAELFPKGVVRKETNQSNDLMYSKYSADEIKTLYFRQAATLWDALVKFIECEFRYEHEYILEGYHIPPELVVQLQETYPIRSVFVGRENATEALEAILQSTQKGDWVLTKTQNKETFPKIAQMLSVFSRDVRIEAEKRDLHYIDIGADFSKGVNQAVQFLKSEDGVRHTL
ncbi:MAG: hypothetical protein AAB573_00995 [Patescibacteria group bacterium]